MKKALVALLILAIAGGAFAQELKFTGYVNTGVAVLGGEDVPYSDDGITSYARDAGRAGTRFQLNGAYTNGDFGFNFRLRAQGQGTANNSLFVHYAYGYATLFDTVKLFAGDINNGSWETQGDWGDDQGEGVGALLQIVAIENLNAGVGIYWTGLTGSSSTTVFSGSTSASGIQYGTAAQLGSVVDSHYLTKVTFGGAYTMPDLFGIQTAWAVGRNKDGEKYAINSGDIGISVLAVPKLTAEFEFVLTGIGNDKENIPSTDVADALLENDGVTLTGSQAVIMPTAPAYMFVQSLGYEINDQLNVGLIAYEYLSTAEFNNTKYDKLSFSATPWVSYKINEMFTPKLTFTYSQHLDPDFVGDFDDWTPTYLDDKTAMMEIVPSILWNVAPNATIDIGVGYYFGKYRDDSQSAYKFYTDFLWKF
jgi:hypothetical protein